MMNDFILLFLNMLAMVISLTILSREERTKWAQYLKKMQSILPNKYLAAWIIYIVEILLTEISNPITY